MIPKIWQNVAYFFTWIPQYDVEQLHARLLVGRDRLWLVAQTAGVWRLGRDRFYMGVVVTTVTAKPPSTRKVFRRSDPAQLRSLTVHLAGGRGAGISGWIDCAVSRISAYGKEQGCRQLFLLAKKSWRQFAMRFYSRDWDTVAYSRDRPVKARCSMGTISRNRVAFTGWSCRSRN
jgi:hypothetical protein